MSKHTDQSVIDAIAVGLGTESEWSGADMLEWIADAIGQVRPHPGDMAPLEYAEAFETETGRKVIDVGTASDDYYEALAEADDDEEDDA